MNDVLAVVPARGGSTGLEGKNLRPLAGKPLIAWTLEAAAGAQAPDRVVVSSDDEEILEVARRFGADAPFVRPARLAEDATPGVEPVLHAARELPGYDVLIVLQPTSPLRISRDIDACADIVLSGRADAAVSVTAVEKPPGWMYRLDDEGRLDPYVEGEAPERRQDARPLYALNGAVYVVRRETLMAEESLLPPRTRGYVMPAERSVDVDTERDLALAEVLIRGGSG